MSKKIKSWEGKMPSGHKTWKPKIDENETNNEEEKSFIL